MSDYILKKIYPKPKNNNYNDLSYDVEGLYSITHPNDADKISEKILNIFCGDGKFVKIVDITASCGGNLISFCKYFGNVTGIEINKNRFDILTKNIQCYDYKNTKINLINDNCLKYLKNNYHVFFIDPPWGGPKYKKENNIKLYLSGIEISDILLQITNTKLIVLKIPYNYNYNYIEEKYRHVIIMKLKNMIILFIFLN